MPDTELRDILAAIADRAEPVDFLARVESGAHKRRRRQLVSAVTLIVVAIGGVAVGAVALSRHGASPPAHRPVVSPTPTPRRSATDSVLPGYLPPGATLISSGPLRFRVPGLLPPKRKTYMSDYELPGVRNANTMPRGGLTPSDATDPRLHPPTDLEITFLPMVDLGPKRDRTLKGAIHPVSKHDNLFRQRRVEIAGNDGIATYDTAEHAYFRVEWLDADGYHAITCDRIITAQGLSGVGLHQMLEVARSLYGE